MQTVRFYVSSMSEAQREGKGITPERARQILKTRKLRRALPRAPGFLFAVRAAEADGRDPAAVTAGYASCSRGARTTTRPQESGRHDIAVDASNRPYQKGSPPTTPRRAVRTPATPLHSPHPRRTPAAPPPHGPHPHRIPATWSAPRERRRPHPVRCARGGVGRSRGGGRWGGVIF